MTALLRLSRVIDRINLFVGRVIPWLLLICIVVSVANATARYVFAQASNAYLELQYFLFAAVFLLCAGYTLLRDEHIRVDVLSSRLSERTRLWIDVIGICLFLLPVVIMIMVYGMPFVIAGLESCHRSSGSFAWSNLFESPSCERSANPGGLIRWPLYVMLPVGFVLLGMQAVSELIKRIAALRGYAVVIGKTSMTASAAAGDPAHEAHETRRVME